MAEFPNEKTVKLMLEEIINCYFCNGPQKDELHELAQRETPPVRHIFTELNKLKKEISPRHGDAIKDIFFLYG
ncbi:MAG: hypothetical protein OET90_02330 [Desulfuromonadales bacterium]|nr:hypothetical protein [Desulfuromonadales bacterium]